MKMIETGEEKHNRWLSKIETLKTTILLKLARMREKERKTLTKTIN